MDLDKIVFQVIHSECLLVLLHMVRYIDRERVKKSPYPFGKLRKYREKARKANLENKNCFSSLVFPVGKRFSK